MIILMGMQVFFMFLYVGLADIINPAPKAAPTPVTLTPAPPTPTPMPTELSKPTAVSDIESGWLCDWDGRGEVALWAKPVLASQEGNSIVAVVGMSVKGCVAAALLDEATSDGTFFYQTRVGDDQGWVGVDYFYSTSIGKPGWSQ